MILYEYPLNERVRSLLRLEDSFQRIECLRESDSQHHHVCAMASLFDLLDIVQRGDARGDLMSELDEQSRTLGNFRDSPGVSAPTLDSVLKEIRECHRALAALAAKPDHALRDNAWLMAIRSRLTIAGGAADYDMPSFWAWQNLPPAQRRDDLNRWRAPFQAYEAAVRLTLRVLRESGNPAQLVANDGTHQHPLSGEPGQLAQLRIDPAQAAIPDISANKYLLWIRFSTMDKHYASHAITRPVPFTLTLCGLT